MHTYQSTVCRHLEKLWKVFKLGVWISHNLNERNEEDHIAVATSILSRAKQELFLDRIITADDKGISNDYIIRKRQWLDKDQAPLQDMKANSMGQKYCVCGGIVLV